MGLPWSVGFNRRWGHGMGWKGGALLRAARNGKPWAFSQLRSCGPGLVQALGFARAAHAQGSERDRTHPRLAHARRWLSGIVPDNDSVGSRAFPRIPMAGSVSEPPSKGPAETAITRWHVSTLSRSDQLTFTSYSYLVERGDRPRQARSRETELWENPTARAPRHITRG